MDMESSGYSPSFLAVEVPLPRALDGADTTVLHYMHFSVLFQPSRRLAKGTAVNINGAKLIDVPRGDDWHYDPRVPEADQVGNDVYSRNDLDRGHLVRRRDPVWGSNAEARAANEATFAFTNAAPQAAPFNQGPILWLGLEDHVLGYAQAQQSKVSVFTGPVLAAGDPEYRGVKIPRLFWKIAAWVGADGGGVPALRAAGFVLDQSVELDVVLGRASALPETAPLGAYLTYQVPVADIGRRTGLAVAELAAADVLRPVSPQPAGTGAAAGARAGGIAGAGERAEWVRLTGPGGIALGPVQPPAADARDHTAET
jgi:endonuclease G